MCIVRVKLILKHVRLAILDWIDIIDKYRKYLSFEKVREKENTLLLLDLPDQTKT